MPPLYRRPYERNNVFGRVGTTGKQSKSWVHSVSAVGVVKCQQRRVVRSQSDAPLKSQYTQER